MQISIGNLKGKRPLGRPGLRCEDLKKYGGRVWIGFMWLKIGTSGGLL
jgi:hypothetical protein